MPDQWRRTNRRTSAARGWAIAFAAWLLLYAAPAYALPGPEVLAPVSLGLVKALVFLGGWTAAQKHWVRRHRLGLRLLVIAVLLAVWNPLSALVFVLAEYCWRTRRWKLALVGLLSLLAMQLLVPSDRPSPLPPLPEPLSSAEPAPPNPRSEHPTLRRGGAVIVHLGEPESFLNNQLRHGYFLRRADLPARVRELTEASDPPVQLVTRDEPAPVANLSLHRMVEPTETTGYLPPLFIFWTVLTPRFLVSDDTADSPLLFQRGVPRLRDIDGAELPLVSASDVLATPTRQMSQRWRSSETVAVAAPDAIRAAAAISRLLEVGVAVGGLRFGTFQQVPSWWAISTQGVVIVLLLLLLLTAALEHGSRALHRRRVARAMRAAQTPAKLWSLLWLFLPCAPALLVVLLVTKTRMPPAIWPLMSPPMFGPWRWLFPLLVVSGGVLWFLRLRRLPSSARRWGDLLGFGMAIWVLSGRAIELYPNSLQLMAMGCGFLGMLLPRWCGQGWCELRVAPRRAGQKAHALAQIMRQSDRVGEGLVLWPARTGVDRLVRELLRRYGTGAYLLRSSAPNELSSHGRFLSLVAEPEEIGSKLSSIVSQYPPGTADAAVLCMPLISARHSGVARLDFGGVVAESGAGRDGITSGGPVCDRAAAGRWSGYIRSAPTINGPLLRELLRLPCAKPMLSEWVGPWIVQHGPAPDPTGWYSEAWRLMEERDLMPGGMRRVGEEGLRDPAPTKTLELWAGCWRRSGSLGRAIRWLGLAASLVPAQVVFPIGGGLYVHLPSWRRLQRLLWLRSRLPGFRPADRFRRIHRTLEEPSFVGLCAASTALRLLQPYLPVEGDEPPQCPSVTMMDHPERFPHRSEFDLDPSAARYGSQAPPPQRLDQLPSRPNQSWCAYVRDWIHDQLCRHVAKFREDDPDWARAEGHGRPPSGELSLEMLEGRASTQQTTGVWVHGHGPIDGEVSESPGPDRILFLARPDPLQLRKGFGAVVTQSGGSLSHAALVCQQRQLTALFGAGRHLSLGERVRLHEDGTVEVLSQGAGTTASATPCQGPSAT